MAEVVRVIRQRLRFDVSSDFGGMDPEIKAIDDALRQQGKTRADLGRHLGLDSAQVSRIFAGKRRMQRHEYQRAMELVGMAAPTGPSSSGGLIVPMPGMVPLYGWVGAASESRLTIADQNLRGYVSAHPNQAHVREPFALEVSDISMVPRYEPGEIVYLSPHRWPARGQDCVVVTRDQHGYLKRFVSRDPEKVNLWQLNPDGPLSFDLAEVEAIHTVVGRG